jgi:hypothetical protein
MREGILEAIFCVVKRGAPVQSVAQEQAVPGHGLEGDR